MISLKNIFSAESIENLTSSFGRIHKRFPLTLLSSFCGTVLLLYLIRDISKTELNKAMFTVILAVPLFFSIEIFNERKQFNKWVPIGLGILFLASFYLFLDIENPFKERHRFGITFAVLAVVFHLLVSVAPFFKKGNIQSFWQYNKTLFLSIINAFLYSFTLSGGLCLALLAINKLFDVEINGEWYRNIFVLINGYFNTVFFLSKLPSLDVIDAKTEDYPVGLKYFTQYVLLPLVAIYILILLAYEFKIIAQWNLPKGWVSVLVMASAIFGILAFLLLYPLRNSNKWIGNFTKIYYWVLLPLIALMMVAIFVRIREYGLTEPRYFIAIVSLWLLGICIYFSLSEIDNIKVIPMSLIAVGLISILGPFNAFFISKYDQQRRLESVLSENNLLKNGKISMTSKLALSPASALKLSSSVDYLASKNVNALRKYFSGKDFELLNKEYIHGREAKFYELTKLPVQLIKQENVSLGFYRQQDNYKSLFKADYSFLIDGYSTRETVVSGSKIEIRNKELQGKKLVLYVDNEAVNLDFTKFYELQSQDPSTDAMTTQAEAKAWKLRLVLDSFVLKPNKEVEQFSGELFLTKK